MEKRRNNLRYCGRDFTKDEIFWIRDHLSIKGINRYSLSKRFCEEFNWRKADGGLKDMSCRVAHLRMEKDGLIKLPPPRNPGGKTYKGVPRTLFTLPQPEITNPAGSFNLTLELVSRGTSSLWNEFIDKYHYLGYTALPGAQLRYFIKAGENILALLGFGAAAWAMECRDRYLGWDNSTRKKNLHLIANNARFLILPWVKSKNLASRILSKVSKRLVSDWEEVYKYRPVLLETCVEKNRFLGTSYKASNWIYAGDTKGRGKLDRHKEYKVPVKSVWLYPLCRNYREYLLDDRT